MYTRFFGLNEKPFAITPDPRYLFMSERHGEGLAHLVYGVTESGGFIQLTGEVGTGKTTLVRTLLGQLPDKVRVALVLNPQLSAIEFLLAICEELQVELPADLGSSKALVDALNRHLLANHADGRRTILLVDEAQNLSEEVLEQVRLLTNLETAKQKLLQIILIGQPELRDLLAQNNLRQLAQRVTGRYHLEPLARDETLQYIDHRLRVAGALTEIFTPSAKRSVHRLSAGIPRLINVICDRALLGAYSLESRKVTSSIVRRAAREVAGTELRLRRWWLPATVSVVALVAVLGWWSSPREGQRLALAPNPVAKSVVTPVNEAVAEVASVPEPAMVTALPAQAAELGTPRLRLIDVLREREPRVENAMQALFALWGGEFRVSDGTGCSQARSLGLACLFQRGSWNVLRQLNHPAMLTLVDENGENFYPVVTAIEGDEAELDIDGERMRFPVSEVNDLWFGRYLILWRPPNGEVVSLQPGSRGLNVIWLRESLARLGNAELANAAARDVFDADLEAALRAFQRRHRLQVDGLAGQQTQVLLTSLLADDTAPQLYAGVR